ncbi:MAG: methyltransferase domain-containing protein [Lentisphaeria bacterium]|nr:methyltransferase domain-containing protein [Lentisphaeria bacterium]
MDNWNSTQYLKFESERTRPAHDLAFSLTVPAPRKVLDVGCGPGNSTQVLRQRFPGAEILGVDNSADMIAKARVRCPDMTFRYQDIDSAFTGFTDKYDVIYSNACLHWIPNHKELLPNMLKCLSPGGVLAVQMPVHQDMPMYRVLAELSADSPWTAVISSIHNFHSLTPEEYYDFFSALPVRFTLWETSYIQTMDGVDGILEWYCGSGLRPYLAALPETEHEPFLTELRKRLSALYTLRPNGKIMMRFPRLFFTVSPL